MRAQLKVPGPMGMTSQILLGDGVTRTNEDGLDVFYYSEVIGEK